MLEAGAASAIIPYELGSEIEIEFNSQKSAGGCWGTSNSKLIVTSPYEVIITGNEKSPSWGMTVLASELGEDRFTPSLRVVFPIEKQSWT